MRLIDILENLHQRNFLVRVFTERDARGGILSRMRAYPLADIAEPVDRGVQWKGIDGEVSGMALEHARDVGDMVFRKQCNDAALLMREVLTMPQPIRHRVVLIGQLLFEELKRNRGRRPPVQCKGKGDTCSNTARYGEMSLSIPTHCGLCDLAENGGRGVRVDWKRYSEKW